MCILHIPQLKNRFGLEVKRVLNRKKSSLPQWPNHIKPGIDLAGRFIKMDGTEENLVLEGYEWKWMGLAALWCNKRNESSNRLSVNSIRDTLTLHKPFIMMMLWSKIFHCGTQSLVWKGTVRDGWSTKVCLGLVYCHSLLFLWRFEAFQPINQWKHAFHPATLNLVFEIVYDFPRVCWNWVQMDLKSK